MDRMDSLDSMGRLDGWTAVMARLPQALAKDLAVLAPQVKGTAEEIRLRSGSPPLVLSRGKEYALPGRLGARQLGEILQRLLQYSYYAYEGDLARGFVTMAGGHRVGVCGRAVVEDGRVKLIKEVSSLNIRFAREVKGCSRRLFPYLLEDGQPVSGLIISPPGCGKTTMLRDLARSFSEAGYSVSICDERSELAGMVQGEAGFDLGPRCDVLDGCDKARGIPMLLRAMAPQVIITDEIGKVEDVRAVEQCLVSGVALITSIHGACEEDVLASAIGPLVSRGVFRQQVYLSRRRGVGTVEAIRSSAHPPGERAVC